MAQTAKKNPGKKSGSNSKKTSTNNKNTKNASSKPIRREVGGIICLFLGLFSLIGYFNVDAWFINVFCGFVKGIIGWGYYIFPPALFLSAYILAFHRGRPVILRTVFAMLLPILLGAFIHLIVCETYEFSKELPGLLFSSGKLMQSGGFLSGILAITLEGMFSIFGALPVLFFLFVFFAMMAMNITISGIIQKFKDRPHLVEYEYNPEPEAIHTPLPDDNVRRKQPRKRSSSNAIDIPLDEEPPLLPEEYEEEKVGFFNIRPRVRTPDQLFSDSPEENETELIIESLADEPAFDMPENAVKEKDEAPVTVTPPKRQAATPVSQVISDPPRQEISKEFKKEKFKADDVAAEASDISKAIENELSSGRPAYEYPPLSLLKTGSRGMTDGREEISINRERLNTTLKSFGVSASIVGVTRGPTVTRYDLELDAGVKLNKLTNLAGDLALSLGVANVRIAPIPDKISTVGVEVPNKLVSTVFLHDIVGSPAFKSASSKLAFAIGEDIGGNAIVGNIAKLPHMLIAGTTGSGKSVCMNSLILSLLYKSTPDEVRLIMIDPKMVELGIYNGIPHLFIPVVTDPKKAAGALQWSVVEMLKRYRLFSEIGVRDLAGYNAYQKKNAGETLPQVVIVIDELADLMLVASKEVEESICRVAQMGRASGMHLIIATQRPSADVITGLMKANIPSRIAFSVSSALESRIILDTQGAEKLIGQGDMLYSPIGAGKPMRVQGAFVSDDEREEVINFIKAGSQVEYSTEILDQIEKAASDDKNGKDTGKKSGDDSPLSSYDELLPDAVDVILETKQASVSMLQRRLKLGYSRAARIVDQMEELGVVGPFEGSKPRQLLVTREQWQEMQLMNGTAPVSATSDEDSYMDVQTEFGEENEIDDGDVPWDDEDI